MTPSLLRIDTSARRDDSVSRGLVDRILARFADAVPGAAVTTRDLGDGLPLIDSSWIAANFTPADDRSDAQKAALALSDTLVEEVKAADIIVIGMPIYNFGAPSSLKAWVDLLARVGITFRYTEAGPEGLLSGKRAIVAVASGGTPVGSEIDFATSYLRHVLGFLGITDVTFVAADQLAIDPDAALKAANDAVDALSLAA